MNKALATLHSSKFKTPNPHAVYLSTTPKLPHSAHHVLPLTRTRLQWALGSSVPIAAPRQNQTRPLATKTPSIWLPTFTFIYAKNLEVLLSNHQQINHRICFSRRYEPKKAYESWLRVWTSWLSGLSARFRFMVTVSLSSLAASRTLRHTSHAFKPVGFDQLRLYSLGWTIRESATSQPAHSAVISCTCHGASRQHRF